MPLTGIKIIDLTRILSGPFCTMLLADMGAEVIKIESPGSGDPIRGQGEMKNGLSWYFASFNRNKKSLTLNLRSDEGKKILRELIKEADVVIDNYRAGVMAKMGFDYPRLKEIKPDIIHCGISGYGVDGPHAQRPAFDFIAQAKSGFMSLNNVEDQDPIRAATPISDLTAGIYGAMAVCAAVAKRERTGEGEEIQTNLADAILSTFAYLSANFLASGKLPRRTGNDHPICSPYGLFQASDGPVAIAPSNDNFYKKLLKALDLEEVLNDPELDDNEKRMTNRAKINALINEKTKLHTREYWVEKINAAGVPCGVIQNLKEVFEEDPQFKHQEMMIEVDHGEYGPVKMTGFPVKMENSPCRIRRPAPKIGEQTAEILTGLGLSTEEMAKLKQDGVI